MIIDSSAVIAILYNEPGASAYASAILSSPVRLMSSVSYVESCIVLIRNSTGPNTFKLDTWLQRMQIDLVPFDAGQAQFAREAYRRFGRGKHPAKLNFGDCFSYALAKSTDLPLLFKGNDFSQTDVQLA